VLFDEALSKDWPLWDAPSLPLPLREDRDDAADASKSAVAPPTAVAGSLALPLTSAVAFVFKLLLLLLLLPGVVPFTLDELLELLDEDALPVLLPGCCCCWFGCCCCTELNEEFRVLSDVHR
jgi:hypothetical protein